VHPRDVWHDPVWSKVIAGIILAAGGAIFAAAIHFDWIPQLTAKNDIPTWVLVASVPAILAVGITISAIAFKKGGRTPVATLEAQVAVAPRTSTPERERPRSTASGEPLRLLDTEIAANPEWQFPLKYYARFRNETNEPLDVRVVDYRPEMVELKQLIFAVLQVDWRGWWPRPDGVERMAIHPDQMMRLWIAVDDKRTSLHALPGFKGHIGTIILSVNGDRREYKL
jgi:hypothetical protein